jgi:signal transduction histidine kinase
MKEEIRVLNRIMTDFLSFARKSRLQMEKVSIPSLLQRTVTAAIASGAISGNVLGSSTIQVQYDLDPDLPEIYADPVELRRALFNILQNAADAMPEGGIVAIHARVTENGHGVDLQISDTGAGIHEKELEKIFHPFYTTKTAGTGLGLAISRKIIEEHGGTVFVQSQEGKGTTFAIALPLLPPIAPYAAASMEPSHEVTKT